VNADGNSPLDLDTLKFEPLADRPSKVTLDHVGHPLPPGSTLPDWFDSLPDVLAVRGLKRLRDAIVDAVAKGRPVVAALGGHVIKTGCGPYLVDWMDRGVLSGLALNGSAAIHDLELAIAGKTSEDVGPRLMAGTFGFARETSDLFADACARGGGLGKALAEVVIEHGGPGLGQSVLVAAHRSGIPLTVHVAVGTDIVHMNPKLDGAALGASTLADFWTLANLVGTMAGGVWMNLGSAVVLPEVFLKTVSIARNLGHSLEGLTTANLDFDQKYRGLLNVLQRPGSEGGGIALTGHHEIMIPLLHAAVAARLPQIPDGEARSIRADPPATGIPPRNSTTHTSRVDGPRR
jgi:hypothetical protein